MHCLNWRRIFAEDITAQHNCNSTSYFLPWTKVKVNDGTTNVIGIPLEILGLTVHTGTLAQGLNNKKSWDFAIENDSLTNSTIESQGFLAKNKIHSCNSQKTSHQKNQKITQDKLKSFLCFEFDLLCRMLWVMFN